MRQIITAQREQEHLLPTCVEDWLGPEHPARYIAQFVEQMDLGEAKLDTLNREEGGKAYAPSLLLAVWLYGYCTKHRSTRSLEQACRENMAFIWLSGNTRPDHNSLWRFWKAHHGRLGELFKQTLKVAMEMNLVGMVAQALDGTKIAAACGKGSHGMEKLEKRMGEIDGQIARMEKAIEQAGNQGADKLPRELQRKKALREQVRLAMQRVSRKESKSVNPREVDATLMSQGPAYNAQAVADTKAQIVVAAQVAAQASDQGQAVPMMEKAKANLREAGANNAAPPGQDKTREVKTLADGGYASAQNFHHAKEGGHELLTPPPASWRDTSNPYHSARFRRHGTNNSMVCPQGRELKHAQRRWHKGRHLDVYGRRTECEGCEMKTRCTRGKRGRTIEVPVQGYEELVRRRAEWEKPEVRQTYKSRAATIEPVFAQIKNVMGFRRWTLKGLEAVGAQWQMLCASWNLKVIIRHWARQMRAATGQQQPVAAT